MADPATEKLQNMNIQDFDGSEFDPYSPQTKMATNLTNESQGMDLLGDEMNGLDLTNGHSSGKRVSFDPEAELGLPDPASIGQGQGQSRILQRNMSEGETLGYQHEYGEARVGGQSEYMGTSGDEDYTEGEVIDEGPPQGDQDYHMQTGQPLAGQGHQGQPAGSGQVPDEIQNDKMEDNNYGDQYGDNGDEDFDGGTNVDGGYYNEQGQGHQETNVDGDHYNPQGEGQQEYEEDECYDDAEADPNSWHPEMDAERSRRSLSPERSVSPDRGGNRHQEMDAERSRRSLTPERSMSSDRGGNSQSEGASGVLSPVSPQEYFEESSSVSEPSQPSQPTFPSLDIPIYLDSEDSQSVSAMSETGSQSSRTGIQRPHSGRHSKSKMKKPGELPPWNDNVVIPKPKRMAPTLIGKEPDLPPPPQSPHRWSNTSHRAKDASSDSGVEEEKTSKLPKRTSSDNKKKYGTDTTNEQYKPGGGNIKIVHQKVLDKKAVKGRTDSSTPKTALSPTPSRVKSPSIPRSPLPKTQNVQSKIGSLNNVKHTPGGGNITVLDTKIDFSTVTSKVGSKDKIHHKPKGGDKKIESRKLNWQTDSRVGSLKNITHSPTGGNVKKKFCAKIYKRTDGTLTPWYLMDYTYKQDGIEVEGTMNTRENIHYQPGGGNIPGPYEEELEWDEEARVNSLDNLDYSPGGGNVKIFSEKLKWNAVAKVDTALHKGVKIYQPPDSCQTRYSSNSRQVAITIEPINNQTTEADIQPIKKEDSENAAIETVDGVGIQSDFTEYSKDKSENDNDELETESMSSNQSPPLKPPRCIHKQWEMDNMHISETIDAKNMEDTLTGIAKEKRGAENDPEKICAREHEVGKAKEGYNLEDNSKQTESFDKGERHPLSETVASNERNNSMTNETDSCIMSVERKEDVIEEIKEIIKSGKENLNEPSDVIEVERIDTKKSKRKSSFASKLKGLISTKKKDEEKYKRFSDTSKVINVVGNKTKKGKDNDEETVTMVKYLGYASPKLGRKAKFEISHDVEDVDKKIKKKPKGEVKRNSIKDTKKVEKLANLGYVSPKLAKKRDSIILTGSSNHGYNDKVKSSGTVLKNHGNINKGFTENGNNMGKQRNGHSFKDANDRVDLTHDPTIRSMKLKGGVGSDYQDIEFDAKVNETRSCREFDCEHVGLVNPGFEVEETGLKYKNNEDDDSGNLGLELKHYSDDELEISYAELELNKGVKISEEDRALQTTTFKYRSESPINKIRQVLIDGHRYGSINSVDRLDQSVEDTSGFLKTEDRRDLATQIEAMSNVNSSSMLTKHDEFGYTLVNKSAEKKEMVKETEKQHKTNLLDELRKMKARFENNKDKKESFCQLSTYINEGDKNDNKINKNQRCNETPEVKEKKRNVNAEDDELTFEEELRAVLAGINDNESRFLRTPSKREGSRTGSRPGTPNISVKPIRLKAEEDATGLWHSANFLGMRKYSSTENLASSHRPTFARKQRAQSMRVGLKGSGDVLVKTQKLPFADGLGAGNLSSFKHQGSGSKLNSSLNNIYKIKGWKSSIERTENDGLKNLHNDIDIQDSDKEIEEFDIFADDCDLDISRTDVVRNKGIFESKDIRNDKPMQIKFATGGVVDWKEHTISKDKFSTPTVDANMKHEVKDQSKGLPKGNVKESLKLDEDEGKIFDDEMFDGGLDMTITNIQEEIEEEIEHTNQTLLVTNHRLSWSAKSRIGSLENAGHSPGGGTVKVQSHQLSWSAMSRVGSLKNLSYSPGGGNVTILDEKVEFKAKSKVGSTANLKHKPGGGDKKIETQKLEFKDGAKSKVGSMDKVKHKPGGGDIKVIDQKVEWKATPRVESLVNAKHVPGGGKVKILSEKVQWRSLARVQSLTNVSHQPKGGDIQILDEKVDFSQTAHSKVGSMDKVKHQPGGGDKKIETQKLSFKETAKPRTNTGVGATSVGVRRSSQDSARSESVTSQEDDSHQG